MIERAFAALYGIGVLAVLFLPLEFAFRARVQRVLRAEWQLDLLFIGGQYMIWNGLSLAALAGLHQFVQHSSPLRLDHLHPVVQVLLAVVLGDLCMYGFHIACHRVPWLWRIHAVHHSSTTLDWAAAHREHPIDGLLTQCAMNAPAVLLGLSFTYFAPVVVFRSLWAVLVHSNTRLPLGPLRWLLGGPEFHRLHHRATSEGVCNFANLAPWIDVLFETHGTSPDEQYRVGVEGLELPKGPSSRSYLQLLLLLPQVRSEQVCALPTRGSDPHVLIEREGVPEQPPSGLYNPPIEGGVVDLDAGVKPDRSKSCGA